MTEIQELTVAVIARFKDPGTAEMARSTIEEMLHSASKEVDSLFASRGGIAESTDVEKIWAKYGFRNDVGWTQQRPIIASGNEIKWDVPLGVEFEDVQLLLLSLGAQFFSLQPSEEDELYLGNLHPLMARPTSELGMGLEEHDEEILRPLCLRKKLLH
jgi:hypothetical protein